MDKNIQVIEMSKQEAIKYYANKIIEDALADCSEYNYCMFFDFYKDQDFIYKNKYELLDEIKKDRRVTDVYLDESNNEYSFNMVFSIDYCPWYYESVDLAPKIEKKYLSLFIKDIKDKYLKRVDEFRISTREIIRNFVDKHVTYDNYLIEDDKDSIYEKVKEHIDLTGFNSKYIDKYEVFINKDNINEFIDLMEKEIKNINVVNMDGIREISRNELDDMMNIYNSEAKFPLKYKGLFIFKENDLFLGVDNLDGKLYIEEFDNIEKCINYLKNEEEEEEEQSEQL